MRTEPGRGIEVGLGLLLGGAVLAFGSTSFWARSALIAATAMLFTAWWIQAARLRPPEGFEAGVTSGGVELLGVRFRRVGFAVPAVILMGIAVLQIVPLPRAARALLAPGSMGLESSAEEVLAGAAADGSRWAPLSARPGDTLDSLLLLVAYGMLFLMVYNVIDSRARLLRMCRVLVIVGFVAATIGLLQDLSGAERIYGFRELRFGGAPYGPYVNHNHYAGLMELIIPIAFGLLLRRLFRPSPPRETGAGAGEPSGPGSTARRLLEGDIPLRGERIGQAVLLGLALAVMLTTLLRCLSRGGLLSLAAASAMVLALLLVAGKLRFWEVGVLTVVAAAGIGLFLWIGPGELLDHFRRAESVQNEPSFSSRLQVWDATLDLFRDHPVLGAGLGTYGAAFLHYYPAGSERIWLQAHDDYVQVLAELGIVGAAVVAYALLVFVVRLLAPLLSRRGVRDRFLYYGLVTGILAILVHSLVDFNLQIPANGAVFVTCSAMALAQRNLFRSGG